MCISCSTTCFLKKYQSHLHMLIISNGMNMSLLLPCFSVLKIYLQRVSAVCDYHTHLLFLLSSLSHETSETFQIWTQCVENKWEGNRVPLGESKLDCTLIERKSHRIIFHILCDMGLPCSKLNISNLIKDRNIIFAVSKMYINIL